MLSTRYINSVQTVDHQYINHLGRPNTNGYDDYTTLPAATQIQGGGVILMFGGNVN
jgi:hypothetical protein